MNFKGQLLIPSESGPGLRVNLDVAAHHLALESESGGLGAWPLEVVDVRRLQGDVFAMTVAGEDLHFVADDALSFAYSGLPAIKRVSKVRPSKVKSRSGLRSWLTKVWGETQTRPADPMPPAEIVEPVVVEETSSMDAGSPDILEVGDAGSSDEVGDRGIDLADDPVAVAKAWGGDPGVDPPAVGTRTPAEGDDQETDAVGCPASRSDGLACQSPILTSSGYCIAHDPERTIAHGYRAAHEARSRLRAQSVRRLNRVYGRLDKAMRQVERGELDPETAMAMAQLARTMCAILALDDEPDRGPEGS